MTPIEKALTKKKVTMMYDRFNSDTEEVVLLSDAIKACKSYIKISDVRKLLEQQLQYGNIDMIGININQLIGLLSRGKK